MPTSFDQTIYQGESFRYRFRTQDGSPIVGTHEAAISAERGTPPSILASVAQGQNASEIVFTFTVSQLLSLKPGHYLFDQRWIVSASEAKTILHGTWTLKPGTPR
jgi:hypothetical protein